MATFQVTFDPNIPPDPAATSETCFLVDASGFSPGNIPVSNFPAATFAFDVPDDVANTIAGCYFVDADDAGNVAPQSPTTPLSSVPPPPPGGPTFSRSALTFTRVDAPTPSGFRVTKR